MTNGKFKDLIKLLCMSCKLVESDLDIVGIKNIKQKYQRLLSLKEDVTQSRELLKELKIDLLREKLKTDICITLKQLLNADAISKKYVNTIVQSVEEEQEVDELSRKYKTVLNIYNSHKSIFK